MKLELVRTPLAADFAPVAPLTFAGCFALPAVALAGALFGAADGFRVVAFPAAGAFAAGAFFAGAFFAGAFFAGAFFAGVFFVGAFFTVVLPAAAVADCDAGFAFAAFAVGFFGGAAFLDVLVALLAGVVAIATS